jgi:hypothetical protein
VRWEELRPTVQGIGGTTVAVDTPVRVLARMGFFEGAGGVRLVLCPSRRAVAAARSSISRLGLPPSHVLVGDLAGIPLARRTASLVVAPFPCKHDPDLLVRLRRTAGVLEAEGVLILHGPVRRSVLGWTRHLVDVLVRRGGGLPAETDVTAWMLRGGFNRVSRIAAGRGAPMTVLTATKSVL